MRKEIIIAIFVGIFVGLAVAFGVWRANSAIKNVNEVPQSNTTETNKRSETSANNDIQISLSQPEDLDVVNDKTTNLAGLTKPNSMVVISAEDKDYIIKSDQNGEFMQEITLVNGSNDIRIHAYDEGLSKSESELTVVYSAEFESN